MNIVDGQGLPDFVMMDDISEQAFMKNLKLRFKDCNLIYTYIGEQIVAMNPFTKVDLYSEKVLKSYKNMLMYEVPPHIFALAEDTFRNMMQTKNDQCVIITGESGAGKTEASKIFMQYIAAVSASKGDLGTIVKSRLLDSNPILEAFGNAKTLRNDNSSRFGKYMEIQFDGIGSPIAGRIRRYLLEKSRVTTRAEGERSFHIYYMMLSQASLCSDLGISSSAEDYHFLRVSSCYQVKAWNDVQEFKDMDSAMDRLGFTAENKRSMWRILAGVLMLGNISFEEGEKIAASDTCKISNKNLLPQVSELLSIPSEVLEQALISRSISSGVAGDPSAITIWFSVEQAEFARDSIARAMYNELFNWVVETINTAIKGDGAKPEIMIGVLDIYGFEIFQINSFEQFCINYCNERLQQLFIKLVLKSEQEEYIREGIEWTEIDYFNNEPIVKLIDGKLGIYKILDDICAVGQASPEMLLQSLDQTFDSHDHYTSQKQAKSSEKIDKNSFRITHYAGVVDYSVEQFIYKNRDTLFESSKECVQASTDPLMATLFPKVAASSKRPPTAGTQFVANVKDLVAKLEASHPHYIRCIKSNDTKSAFKMDDERVKHQSAYLNLVETVRVRRAGFCAKLPYDRFLNRYKLVCPDTWPHARGAETSCVQTIMSHLGIPNEEFEKGTTKLFVKNPSSLVTMEKAREARLPHVVGKIQALYRGYKARKFVREQRSNLELLKYAMRIWRFWLNKKLKDWLETNMDQFVNCTGSDNWGKNYEITELPKALRGAMPFLKRIQLTWWGTKKVISLPTHDRAHMRQKILAWELFKDKKVWDLPARFEADYMSKDHNRHKDMFTKKIQEFFQKNGDEKIMFADLVEKVNRKGKSQPRVIIISDQNVYKFDPKKYTVKKEGIPLQKIKDVAMSPFSDRWLVIHMDGKHRDLVLNMGVGLQKAAEKNGVRARPTEKYSELTTILFQLLKDFGTDLPVHFDESITYNNSRDPEDEEKKGEDVTLTFEALDASQKKLPKKEFTVRGRSSTVHYIEQAEGKDDGYGSNRQKGN